MSTAEPIGPPSTAPPGVLRPEPVAVVTSFNARGMWEAPFWNVGAQAGHRHLHRLEFPTLIDAPPELERLGGELIFSDCGREARQLFTYRFRRAVALLVLRSRTVDLLLLGDDRHAAAALAAAIESELRGEPQSDDTIPITYWTLTETGPRQRGRDLAVPAWEDIARNYATRSRTALTELADATEPGAGRLLIWHGPPGTGKTTALRALAGAWRDWCRVHYVVDPEEFFGRGAAYLTDVLLDRDAHPAGGPGPTRLVVLEDAGELIAADARRDTGQGLSRLLGVTDGMLGQALDTVIIITTNEPIASLHPAATRAGRCWAEVAFEPLALGEANAWLGREGSDRRVRRPSALAELYALRDGRAVPPRPPFGFAAAA
jgi:hypothetical protein